MKDETIKRWKGRRVLINTTAGPREYKIADVSPSLELIRLDYPDIVDGQEVSRYEWIKRKIFESSFIEILGH